MNEDERIIELALATDALPVSTWERKVAKEAWRKAIMGRSLARWREMLTDVPDAARTTVARIVWFDLLSYGSPEREEDRVATKWADLLRLLDDDDGENPDAVTVEAELCRLGYLPSRATAKGNRIRESANLPPGRAPRPDVMDDEINNDVQRPAGSVATQGCA